MQWFMGPGTTPNTVNISLSFLHDNYDAHIISGKYTDLMYLDRYSHIAA
jgi:hypothetical protein